MIQAAQASATSLAVANSNTTGENEPDTDTERPPQSIIDTDSDGGLLGAENI